MEAAKNNQINELKNLLDQGADIHAHNDETLRFSAWNGQLEIIKFLIARGADIHAADDGALRWSALMGHLDAVKFLTAQGADIHADDDEALKESALLGNLNVFKFLISHGANIHINNDCIFRTAIINENEPILMLLNAFLTEEKLLVAAIGVTSARSCLRATEATSGSTGMPLVAASGVMLLVPEVVSVALVAALGSMPHTQPLPIIKIKRSRI